MSALAAYMPLPTDDGIPRGIHPGNPEGQAVHLGAMDPGAQAATDGPPAPKPWALKPWMSKPWVAEMWRGSFRSDPLPFLGDGAGADPMEAALLAGEEGFAEAQLPWGWTPEGPFRSPLPPEMMSVDAVLDEGGLNGIPVAKLVPDPIDVPPLTLAKERKAELQRKEEETKQTLPKDDLAEALAAAKLAIRRVGYQFASKEMAKVAVIDFTKPSYLKRMGIFDLSAGESTRAEDPGRPPEPVSRHLVAHGMNSGAAFANRFSNRKGSHMSSPGLYRVGEPYSGSHGPSLRLHGLEPGLNDNAFERDIVLHSAKYVSYGTIAQNILELQGPRIGRSYGCPAVSPSDLKHVEEQLAPGSLIYIHVSKHLSFWLE